MPGSGSVLLSPQTKSEATEKWTAGIRTTAGPTELACNVFGGPEE